METQFFSLFFNITLFIVIKLSSSSIEVTSIFPVYKIMLAKDLNHLDKNPYLNWELDSKGIGIIFNKTSNESYIPMSLFEKIKLFYQIYEDMFQQTKIYKNKARELIVYANLERGYEDIHLALEFIGITIPLKYLFVDKGEKFGEKRIYRLRFLTRENQEHIIFGKDLIEIMDIEFKDESNFIICNKEFVSKFDN